MESAVPSTSAGKKSAERKTSGLKPTNSAPAETKRLERTESKRLERKASNLKPADTSNSSENQPSNEKASDGKPRPEAGTAETKASEAGAAVNTEFKPIDGMGMASDLIRLRGMNNPLEVVKWTYMSPALEDERKAKDIRSQQFWSGGQPPRPRDLEREKELAKLVLPKPGDKDYCILKYGNNPSPKHDYCSEHGWISGPESIQPPTKPEIPENLVNRLEMVGIDKMSLAECITHGDLKINIFVEVEVVETFDKWDVRKDTIVVPCGFGHQPLRWLGQAACIRVASLKNEPSSKFLPLDIKSANGIVLDPDMPIRDVLSTGAKVIVDYSSGPSTFSEPWLGRPAPPTPNKLIKEFFDSQPKGPVVADVPPPKQPPPKKKKKKKKEEAPPVADPDNPNAPPPEPPVPQFLDQGVQTPVDIITFLDWPAYNINALLSRVMPDLDETARETEFMVVQEIMTACSGTMQAIVLWFSSQGKELEDKDFGLLNQEQYMNLFRDLKMCPQPFSENKLTGYFTKYVNVNNLPGSYQLSSWGLFPIFLHLASDMYHDAEPKVRYHEKVTRSSVDSSLFQSILSPQIYHFFVDDFLPNFNALVKSTLEDLHSAETAQTAEAIKEREETARAALRVAIPEYTETPPVPESMDPNVLTPGVPDLSTPELKAAAVEEALRKAEEGEIVKKVVKEKDKVAEPTVFANAWAQVEMEVDAKTIMPYFKKWLALGERWDDFVAAGVIIYALQTPLDVMDFAVKTATMRFGVQEIQRFLLAASHCIFKRTPLVRVSEHSFLRTYMEHVFYRAGVARPLYSTYQEKLEYMRQQCFRHEEPLPKLLEKKKGFL